MTFEEEYYVQTESTGQRNLWMKKFGALAEDLICSVPLSNDMRILEFGCAAGGLLSALKRSGLVHLKGTDISYWAVKYAHDVYGLEEEVEYCNLNLLTGDLDVVLMLDVLEHVPTEKEICRLLSLVRRGTKLVVRVPVSVREGDPYYLEVSRNDVTHVQCHTSDWWHSLLEEEGYSPVKTLSGPAIYESDGVFARVYVKWK
ncbi:MAG: class I SAM-dependent methyltransferase [Candidatus Thorarchaeota archaeon]|jgi:2-polyprenyl-3-methyl-5-hydroxy-6-metoxy-1,4-benzoquinol methylase